MDHAEHPFRFVQCAACVQAVIHWAMEGTYRSLDCQHGCSRPTATDCPTALSPARCLQGRQRYLPVAFMLPKHCCRAAMNHHKLPTSLMPSALLIAFKSVTSVCPTDSCLQILLPTFALEQQRRLLLDTTLVFHRMHMMVNCSSFHLIYLPIATACLSMLENAVWSCISCKAPKCAKFVCWALMLGVNLLKFEYQSLILLHDDRGKA